jgi:NADPH:quinone reductase-like Zn-dependent oxidoreductase
MSNQKAVVVTQPKRAGLVTDRTIPKLRDDYVLVKTVSVGLNPSDWKHVDFLSPPGVLLGGDYSGIVEAVGKNVKLPWKRETVFVVLPTVVMRCKPRMGLSPNILSSRVMCSSEFLEI